MATTTQNGNNWGRGNIWGITLGVFLGISLTAAFYYGVTAAAVYLSERAQTEEVTATVEPAPSPRTPSPEERAAFLEAVEAGSVPEMLALVQMKRQLEEEEQGRTRARELRLQEEARRKAEEEEAERRRLARAVLTAPEDTARAAAAYRASLARMPYGATTLSACLARARQAPNVGIQEEMEATCRRAWR